MPKGVMYDNGASPIGYASVATHLVDSAPASLMGPYEQKPLPKWVVHRLTRLYGTGMWIGTMVALNCGGTVITQRTQHLDADALLQCVVDNEVTDLTIVVTHLLGQF